VEPGNVEEGLDYIRGAEEVTDVVFASPADGGIDLHALSQMARELRRIFHVNALRVRCVGFAYRPERLTPPLIEALGALNRLTVADPLRLEIETQFLHAEEILPVHARLARALGNQGITVYSNTPLLGGVNDSPEEIHRVAFALRRAGIEFHHLYVAGLPIQENWNRDHPVDVADVIDIASRVRREGSGREIPRYIIQTPLGEVDFGLTSKMLDVDGRIRLKLTPYDIDYYRALAPEFVWPNGVTVDPGGSPVVEVGGLRDTGGFLL
jgi:L-lysine 2,3-aminomutase